VSALEDLPPVEPPHPDRVRLRFLQSGEDHAIKEARVIAGTTVFDAASGTWSAVQHVGGSAATPVSPAVTAGVCMRTAELVYVDAGAGAVQHSSLTGATWSAPVLVGGAAMKGVAIAGVP